MQVRILKPGMLSTVQDMGRLAYLADAVPVSGAMDKLSAAIANIACGNVPDCTVLEITLADVSFYAETDLLIAYSGDGAYLFCDSEMLDSGKPLFIKAGNTLIFKPIPAGCRTYLAVAGGWNVPEVLGSRSTCLVAGFGGLGGRALHKNDLLVKSENTSELSDAIFNLLKGDKTKQASWGIAREMFLPADRKVIRITPGPEFAWFSALAILNFLSKPYTLTTDCNRMGYKLDGELLEKVNNQELISTAVTPGTIQVPGDGRLILLMADCQTTGGYPRIAQVAAIDMPLCAQLKPGDEVFFSGISRHEAERLLLQQETELLQLQDVVRSKYL